MPLPDKQELYKELRVIADTILNEIVGPVCHISGIQADIWCCDIEVWTFGDEEANEEIRAKIAEKYNLNEEQMIYIDEYTTLIEMALFIYLAQQ